jgi:DNA-binding response OmpR family regulator
MPKKVLLISNDSMTFETINSTLEGKGYTVLTIALYGNTSSLIREEKPDLIILDTENGTNKGLSLSHEIKSDPLLQSIPVLLLVEDTHDYLLKPIEPKLLELKVQKMIGNGTHETTKKKIVIIDDEIDLCKTLAYRLEKWGFVVKVAHDGISGYRLIHTEIPDLIILDLYLPELSGEDVCKKVRTNENLDSIPIIMLTAKDTEVDKIIGKVIGANAYITKPFRVDELAHHVSQLTHTTEKL